MREEGLEFEKKLNGQSQSTSLAAVMFKNVADSGHVSNKAFTPTPKAAWTASCECEGRRRRTRAGTPVNARDI